MSLHLFRKSGRGDSTLQLLCAYENGHVALFKYEGDQPAPTFQGNGWVCAWNIKIHADSGKSV